MVELISHKELPSHLDPFPVHQSLVMLLLALTAVWLAGCTGPATTTPLAATPAPPAGAAANADVLYVVARQNSNGAWSFDVTVSHPDAGWDDYCDGWDIVLPDDTVLKADEADAYTRALLHPHVDEQPFTRSQGGLFVPEGVPQLTVRAHDIVDGWGGLVVVVDLTAAAGPGYKVQLYGGKD